ncbi:MAG: AmmeMemoRadiSam system protein B [Chloroflexi bacterium RBG_16_69_14]|nr:MAG: AmmeMemoRadiSam system protein B [Chloroflexi bacterium RBG_16_69_14]
MATRSTSVTAGGAIRRPAVAGSFYPAESAYLDDLVEELLGRADRLAPAAGPVEGPVLGLLVPHAGLVYSGAVAAAGWRLLGMLPRDPPPTVVLLGTNHTAGWLDGVAAWETGAWRTPLGDVSIDADLAGAIVDLGPPFIIDRAVHLGEHSIEVQLPLLQTVESLARIVPLSVAAGTGDDAIAAGDRLGTLLAQRRAAGEPIFLALTSDMAHYPPDAACAQVTADLLPPILSLDPGALARAERGVVAGGVPGLVCGMCGIQPTVLGLAALRALGATHGSRLAAATSADAGGSTLRTVGYLAVAFTA